MKENESISSLHMCTQAFLYTAYADGSTFF